ncbi:MAG: hypothetical protein EA395_02620 [Phormidium sp. GEM2.Bin31]|nr:hypothetical protein [Phormidium sp. BM_Day4_Bin.17]TVR14445.1 MAG: hypothetical protein EA395_02620 [Phormidium sp. GEM2.Bin31]UCJ14087.1 MAG: hypothetical protein JWS08_10415 [Phormidium sp. PBR-2020]
MTYIFKLAERQELMTAGSYHEKLKVLARQLSKITSTLEHESYLCFILRVMVEAPSRLYWKPVKGQQDSLYLQASETAWDYIERKLRGKVLGGKAYDPDAGNGSLITLWNIRCKGEYLTLKKQEKLRMTSNLIDTSTGEPLNLLENLAAPPNSDLPMIEQIRQAIVEDVNGKFQGAWVHKASRLTAQTVCLHIVDSVLRGENWTLASLAAHFQISQGSMNSAWTRTLKPLLGELSQEWDAS